MLKTIKQAERTYCPFSMHTDDPAFCVTDKCMGWLWYDDEYRAVLVAPGRRPMGEGWKKHGQRGEGFVWTLRRPYAERRGFCGMADHNCGACARNRSDPIAMHIDKTEPEIR